MPGPPPIIHSAATAVASASASVSASGGAVLATATAGAGTSPYLTPPFYHFIPDIPVSLPTVPPGGGPKHPDTLLHYSFPSEADTLAYVDALKHSDLSDWRSLQEVAARAGAGSCSGAVTTSVLTALYLLGLFNLCAASPASCCVPPASGRRRRRKREVDATLPPLLNNLQHNLSSLSLEQFPDLPHVTTADGGRIPLHISVVDQVRKLWDSNPRLLSSVACTSPTESVRSSFISLSGVASGIILAYSVAQLTQCYPDHIPKKQDPPKIWFFPIPNPMFQPQFPVPLIPSDIPVPGDDEDDDGCERNEVPLGNDKCAPLLSSEPCPYRHWVLLNKESEMGECVPRLCSENFVYVEADQMCHDINEPGICPGDRRLYLTASGNAVCDCPEGMFPGPQNACYYLHEPAFCSKGQVLQFNKPTKSLVCKPDPCGHVNENLWPDDLPYAPRSDGYCYQFNEQGPCKKGQRFGFDSDKLEATCVSLSEAGLIRQKRRSYTYQEMSYPASGQDKKFPHYRVSYIIMNGTTWDLEVKGIGRSKRDISHPSIPQSSGSYHYLHGKEMAVPFIDTRQIPTDFLPYVKPRIPRWVTNKNRRRRTSNGDVSHKHGRNHHISSMSDTINISIDNTNRFNTNNANTNTTQSGKSGNHDRKRKKKSRKRGSSKRNKTNVDAPGEISENLNSTSHNNIKKRKKKSMAQLDDISDDKNSNQRNNKKKKKIDSNPSLQNERNVIYDIMETSDITAVEEGNTNIEITTPENNGKRKGHNRKNSKRKSRSGIKNRTTTINEETSQDPNMDKKKNNNRNETNESTNDSNNQNQKGKINQVVETNNQQVQTPPFGVLEPILNIVDQEEIIKVDQSAMSVPVTVDQTQVNENSKKNNQRRRQEHRHSNKSSKKKGRERRKGRNRKRGRSRERNRNRGRGKGRGRHRKHKGKKKKPNRSKGGTKTKKGKRKNPKLPFRVPTVQPPLLDINDTKTIIENENNFDNSSFDTSSERNTRLNVNFVNSNITSDQNAQSISMSGVANKTEHDVNFESVNEGDGNSGNGIEGDDIGDGENGENGDGNGETEEGDETDDAGASSSESSLPKYLRHRGRRQLGEGGGIIQAPLLSACKPGARRDYNYKCRPKFIPQEKDRRGTANLGTISNTAPRQPSISCPKGTRLDPRGKCQQVLR